MEYTALSEAEQADFSDAEGTAAYCASRWHHGSTPEHFVPYGTLERPAWLHCAEPPTSHTTHRRSRRQAWPNRPCAAALPLPLP